MASGQNPLLELLLGGASTPDPTAQFVAEAFLKGQTPGDQAAAFQNALTNLAPSVIAERRRLGPQPGEELGVSPEDASQAILQGLGLELSAEARQSQQMDVLKLMEGFLRSQQEFGLEEEKVDVSKRRATTAEGELTRKEATDQILNAWRIAQTRHTSAMAEGREQGTRFREMARTGLFPDGRPIPPEQIRNLRELAGLAATSADPNILRTAQNFLNSGDKEQMQAGADLIQDELSIDTTGFASPESLWGYLRDFLNSSMPQPVQQPGSAIRGRDQGGGLDQKQLDLFQEEMQRQFGGESLEQGLIDAANQDRK